MLSAVIGFLSPYVFSPLIAVSFALTLLLYLRGLWVARRQGLRTGVVRPASFLLGLGLSYGVMHTGFDYYAQYMFFMHRLQHLVLHHAGPFLIALAVPWPVLGLGMPRALRERLQPLWTGRVPRRIYRFVQHPVVAPVLFVGLIYFWLVPAIHFDAMLSLNLYHLMNWTMLLDGVLFWWLILDPRDPAEAGTLAFGKRAVILILIAVPQIVLGAYIALSSRELYDVYSVCGRAWPIAARTDQELGGLVTWIPGAMMSMVGALAILKSVLHPRTADLARSDSPARDAGAAHHGRLTRRGIP